MFCDKCGAQLVDTASFCNKCGNTVTKRTSQATSQVAYSGTTINHTQASAKKKKGMLGFFLVLLVIILIAIGAVVVFFATKSRPTIYGTWSDSSRVITFSFEENGDLRVADPYNILGAELFTFKEEDGVIRLQAKDEVAGIISLEMDYELAEDSLQVSILGYSFTLYRVEESDATGNIVEDILEDTLDMIQIKELYGTWSDSTGIVSFTFYENGKIRISGLEETLGVDVFTFSEVDDDTLQLKADSDNELLANPLLGIVSLNLDYEITDNVMTVSIAGQSFKLYKLPEQ